MLVIVFIVSLSEFLSSNPIRMLQMVCKIMLKWIVANGKLIRVTLTV